MQLAARRTSLGVLALHGVALALALLALTGVAPQVFALAAVGVVAGSSAVARRIGAPAEAPSIAVPVQLAVAARSRVSERVPA